ncbi:hypothetical protein F5J12DRAFT_786021 [Pisolithus orientalis]|uniref:uncharacterized protein n=1 Tax=Pisolithus orientalis TaxID=936130 RepID=UPI0022247650|nr:uncharacterized protein F5J12DRAFT_786021 [Pisolithus orientalis]KAI5993145.1 hypothetical protein F5J12DRAFT_786021 [Pisolithus orientalis]
MSPNVFKIPNSALTPIDAPKTAEAATDMFSNLYSLVNFSPNSLPPKWAAPAAVTTPSTIDPALLSLNAYPPPDIPANDIPVTEMTGHDTDVNFHSILTFHNTLKVIVHVLDCFIAKQVVSEKTAQYSPNVPVSVHLLLTTLLHSRGEKSWLQSVTQSSDSLLGWLMACKGQDGDGSEQTSAMHSKFSGWKATRDVSDARMAPQMIKHNSMKMDAACRTVLTHLSLRSQSIVWASLILVMKGCAKINSMFPMSGMTQENM